jgi:HlyD family secretion protein
MQNRETKRDSAMTPLLVAAAAAIAVAFFATRGTDQSRSNEARAAAAATAPAAAPSATSNKTAPAAVSNWAASAPGRIEPKGGEIKVSPLAGGRITDVMVSVNQKVVAGDLLVRLDDSEIEARIAAADAEASVRKRDRDAENVTGVARDRRAAEDAAFEAERLHSLNRAALDRWLVARRQGLATDVQVIEVRDTVIKAKEAMDTARATLRRALVETKVAQTRLEAALAAARSELAVADAASERAHIRAPKDGTILQLSATPGESVAPSPENVLLILGDISGLRVKAEIEERDVGKVRIGQAVVIRSDAFPGRDFEGRVAAFAQALGPSKLGQKGPRKTSDVDVLEVTIEVVGQTPLLPGMRVDTFFKPDTQAKAN